jgi:hypothetical protein
MRKSILYRLFRLGSIPRRLRPVLRDEGIVLAEEGIPGRLVTRDLKGPGKRYLLRSEGFSGSLVITRRRIVCFTYWKRQINISVEDPRLAELRVSQPNPDTLVIGFESSVFRDGWSGQIEFRFGTDQAERFEQVLRCLGVGACPGEANF